MLYIKSTLSPKLLPSSSPTSTFDMISVQFFTPDPTIITLVYRPPDCSHTDSICLYLQLSDVLNHAGSCNMLILSDFNLPYYYSIRQPLGWTKVIVGIILLIHVMMVYMTAFMNCVCRMMCIKLSRTPLEGVTC